MVIDNAIKQVLDDELSEWLLRSFLSTDLFQAGLYCRATTAATGWSSSRPTDQWQGRFDEIEQYPAVRPRPATPAEEWRARTERIDRVRRTSTRSRYCRLYTDLCPPARVHSASVTFVPGSALSMGGIRCARAACSARLRRCWWGFRRWAPAVGSAEPWISGRRSCPYRLATPSAVDHSELPVRLIRLCRCRAGEAHRWRRPQRAVCVRRNVSPPDDISAEASLVADRTPAT